MNKLMVLTCVITFSFAYTSQEEAKRRDDENQSSRTSLSAAPIAAVTQQQEDSNSEDEGDVTLDVNTVSRRRARLHRASGRARLAEYEKIIFNCARYNLLSKSLQYGLRRH